MKEQKLVTNCKLKNPGVKKGKSSNSIFVVFVLLKFKGSISVRKS